MISILILSYNTIECTKLTLLSLKAHSPRIQHEVIVLDNGSIDGSREWLRQIKWKNFKYIESPVNTLFSSGNNLLRFLCDRKSEYILLLNSDVQINQIGWLDEMVDLFKDSAVGVAGPPGYVHNINAAGKFFIDDYLKKYGEQHRERLIQTCTQKNIIKDITGWALLTRTHLWDRLGGLWFKSGNDKSSLWACGNYEHMWSDTMYSIEVQMLGFKLINYRSRKMQHLGSLSTLKRDIPKQYIQKVNRIKALIAVYEARVKLTN